MFWSRNSKTVAIIAGMKAAHLAQTGKSKIGISHGLPEVVPKVVGKAKVGKPATPEPWTVRAHRARKDAVTTPTVGAKLLTVSRTLFVK